MPHVRAKINSLDIKMKKLFLALVLLSSNSLASSDAVALKQVPWQFEGAFGTVDRQAAQRGFQVYKEVCSSCHALEYMSYRNLQEIGFSEEEVKAISATATMADGPNNDGDMFERPGRPSDRFKKPFANEEAARASNGGALPPNLSLIVKSRPNGANYLYSLLTGYEDAPHDMKMGVGMNYNKYFPGHQIAMAKPLSDGQVEYMDGTTASVDQMAKDVTVFLQWAAEPEMEQRKRMGIKVFIYLGIFTVLFYLAKNIIWRDVK
jgi:ubiquinol-cytochrome c reductase cytochrome c1 subunit